MPARVGHRHSGVTLAVDADHALARLDHAAQHAHQRRFAGAVLADQAQHLAAKHTQADIVEGPDAGVDLADPCEFQQRLRHSAFPPAQLARRLPGRRAAGKAH
jgi:hypothetical protein